MINISLMDQLEQVGCYDWGKTKWFIMASLAGIEGEGRECMTHVNMKDREIKRNTSKDAIIFVIPYLIILQKSNKNIQLFCWKIIAHRLPLIFSCALK